MDYVQDVKVKQKAFLLEAVTGGGCIPATYSIKDTNGINLLCAFDIDSLNAILVGIPVSC
jgi:hypothetical protein